jgi:hypothetical protein
MSFLNLNYGLIIYEDPSDRLPNIRLTDISKTLVNICADHEESDKYHLGPNETVDMITTLRALGWTALTGLDISRPINNEDNIRIKHDGNGPAPAFRTNRAIGGSATTQVSISRSSPYVAKITQNAGTPWTLTNVQVGDILKIEKTTDSFTSPFTQNNQGKSFVVQAKGTNYIEVLDEGAMSLDTNIVLGANFEFAFRVFSQGPVKIGDTISIDGNINPANKGKFQIVDLSYDYVEIVNPFAITETIVYGTNKINIYDYLIGFIHLRASGPIKAKFDDQAEWVKVEKLQTEALLIASIEAYKVRAFNDSQESVTISVQHASIQK